MLAKDDSLFKSNNFDLIRLFAAFQVAYKHTLTHLGIEHEVTRVIESIFQFFPGVPIFFVLSGFLISKSFESNPCLVDYGWNRAIRIFPALWVCLIVSVVSVSLSDYRVECTLLQCSTWGVAQLSCLQFYNPTFLRGYGVGVLNGSLWTIPVELQFYILAPLTYLGLGLLRKQCNLRVLLLTLLFFSAREVFRQLPPSETLANKLFEVSFVPYFCMFLTGVMVQRNILRCLWLFKGKAPHWLAAHIITSLGLEYFGVECTSNDLNSVSILLLSGLTISAGFTAPQLSHRILRRSDFSYGIYIYHMPTVNFFVHQGWSAHYSMLLAVLGLTSLMAYCSWHTVEKQSLRFKRRSLRQPTAIESA